MTTPSFESVDSGQAKWKLCVAGALFAFALYRAVRGHPADWFLCALFGAVAASSLSTIVHGTRWQKPMKVMSYALTAAAAVGIAFDLYAMR